MDFENAKEYFTLKNRDDVIKFEKLVESYNKERSGYSFKLFSLIKAYDYLYAEIDDQSNRQFTALFDIYINLILLHYEHSHMSRTWYPFSKEGKLKGGSVLDSKDKFFGKMDIHRYSSSFILRYRALWDKIMGFLILIYAFDEHENYNSAKSRKKKFEKIAKKSGAIPNSTIELIVKVLEEFDNKFRTSEAHGTGSLRKESFSMSGEPQYLIKLTTDWWDAIDQMCQLMDRISDASTESDQENST